MNEIKTEAVNFIQKIIDEENIPYDGDGNRIPLGLELFCENTGPVDLTVHET